MARKQRASTSDVVLNSQVLQVEHMTELLPQLLVVGGATLGPGRNRALVDFPLELQRDEESVVAYIARVDRRLRQAIQAGATHLVIPRDRAHWIADSPDLETYLSTSFALCEATREGGIVFALNGERALQLRCEASGWQAAPGAHLTFCAERRLIAPQVRLIFDDEIRGRLRLSLSLRTSQLRTLRVRAVLSRADRKRATHRDLYLSVTRPGAIFHQFLSAQATFAADGWIEIECVVQAQKGRALSHVELQPINDDNWRVHPMFPGGTSFALPDAAPKGAELAIRSFNVTQSEKMRRGHPHGVVTGVHHVPYRKDTPGRRDAVIFSSWAPTSGLILGDYFIEMLKRWHSESRIFVGVNHGSDPEWTSRLEGSGLDICIAPASQTLTMPFDPTGFVAALNAYRQDRERFDLVWFGHNKGGAHLDEVWYGTGRWMLERSFWSRRQEIEAHFENPVVGAYAPHYLMLLQDHLRQTDALERMYRSLCRPLGAMAVSAHFVLRDAIVRDFCERVSRRFFTHGPEAFGGDRFFVEMALPDIALMQGYEPYLESGLGGLSQEPKRNGSSSVLNDWRNNQAVVAIELDKWRMAPTTFRTAHREHIRID